MAPHCVGFLAHTARYELQNPPCGASILVAHICTASFAEVPKLLQIE
jgi:hypothetical protein